jgi:hypothetical protein
MGDGHDHVSRSIRSSSSISASASIDLGAARRGELVADLGELVADDGHDALARATGCRGNRRSRRRGRSGLVADLVAAQPVRRCRRRARMARACSSDSGWCRLFRLVARIGDQRDQRRHIPPASPGHQLLARLAGSAAADHADDLVDIGDGDGQTDQHMAAVARLAEFELGAAGDDFLAEVDEAASMSRRPICSGGRH